MGGKKEEKGEDKFAATAMKDITERKKTGESLGVSETKFRREIWRFYCLRIRVRERE